MRLLRCLSCVSGPPLQSCMPSPLPKAGLQARSACTRGLKIKGLNCNDIWATLRDAPPPPTDGPASSLGAKVDPHSSGACALLPGAFWRVQQPVLWDGATASVRQVVEASLRAVFTSLRSEQQAVGYAAAVQAPGSSWQQLVDLQDRKWRKKLTVEQLRQLQTEAAVQVFSSPPVRVKAGQEHEACMVARHKEVHRSVLSEGW